MIVSSSHHPARWNQKVRDPLGKLTGRPLQVDQSLTGEMMMAMRPHPTQPGTQVCKGGSIPGREDTHLGHTPSDIRDGKENWCV